MPLKVARPFLISRGTFFGQVLSSVRLDGETLFRAKEIENAGTELMLSPKLRAEHLAAAQQAPEGSLGVGRIAAEVARMLEQADRLCSAAVVGGRVRGYALTQTLSQRERAFRSPLRPVVSILSHGWLAHGGLLEAADAGRAAVIFEVGADFVGEVLEQAADRVGGHLAEATE